MKALTLFAATAVLLLNAQTAHGECVSIIRGHLGAQAGMTAFNAGTAVKKSGWKRVIGTAGTGAGLYNLTTEQIELNLIDAARTKTSNNAQVTALEPLVRSELARTNSPLQPSREDIMAAVNAASEKETICNKWYGAMTMERIAKQVAEELIANPPLAKAAPEAEVRERRPVQLITPEEAALPPPQGSGAAAR